MKSPRREKLFRRRRQQPPASHAPSARGPLQLVDQPSAKPGPALCRRDHERAQQRVRLAYLRANRADDLPGAISRHEEVREVRCEILVRQVRPA